MGKSREGKGETGEQNRSLLASCEMLRTEVARLIQSSRERRYRFKIRTGTRPPGGSAKDAGPAKDLGRSERGPEL